MTEKQFTDIEVGADTGRVRLYNGINFMEYSSSELLDLLNEQHEKIQQQKEAIEHLSYDSEYLKNNFEDKCKENGQFKKALQIAYNETKLTEQTRQTLEKIAELTGVELE